MAGCVNSWFTLADLGEGRQDIFLINMKYFTIQLFLVHGTFCSNSFFHRFFAVKKQKKTFSVSIRLSTPL